MKFLVTLHPQYKIITFIRATFMITNNYYDYNHLPLQSFLKLFKWSHNN